MAVHNQACDKRNEYCDEVGPHEFRLQEGDLKFDVKLDKLRVWNTVLCAYIPNIMTRQRVREKETNNTPKVIQ